MQWIGVLVLSLASLVQDPNELFLKEDWPNAVVAYEHLTREQPNVPRNWMRLGIIRMNLKRFDEAIPAFEKAIENKGNGWFARYQLACAHARLGHTDDAIKNLTRAAELEGVWANQLRTDEHFTSIRSDLRFVALLDRLEHITRGMPGADALDHWIGEWDVYSSGQLVGTNHITRTLDGFGVEERWQAKTGRRGQSFFVFLPEQGKWKQLWTSDRGWRVEKVGTPIENGIKLEGTSTQKDGSTVKTRETLTKNADGTVRQLLEDYDEANGTWKVVFDGTYKKKNHQVHQEHQENTSK